MSTIRTIGRWWVVVSLGVASTALAQDDHRFHEKLRIEIGGFWATVDSSIGTFDEDGNPLPIFDLENLLNVEDSKGVGWGNILWQISPRNSLELEYFVLNRNGASTRTFDPPLQIFDTYIEGGTVSTNYDTSIGRITYGFDLLPSERSALRLHAGLHIAELSVGFGLSGQICDPSTTPTEPPGCPAAGTGQESSSVTAPLPHFGLSYTYVVGRDWAIRAQALGFAIEVDDIDGSLLELDADVVWQPWDNFGFGLGVRYFNTNVKDGIEAEYDIEYFGPILSVTAAFY